VVTEVGKAGPGDETHVSCADHRDAHEARMNMVNVTRS
jgi:hypothetical protein